MKVRKIPATRVTGMREGEEGDEPSQIMGQLLQVEAY